MPHSRRRVSTESRVTPGRIVPVESGGVRTSSPIRIMMFMVPTSSRYFRWAPSSQSTCVKPAWCASSEAAQAGRVVAAGLGPAEAAFHGAHVLVLDADLDRVHAFLVVGADGGQDDEVEVLLGRAHAEERLAGDDRRPDVERGAHARGHPVLLQADQVHQRLEAELRVDLRDAEATGREVHPLDVLLGAEEPHPPVRAAERLQPVEDRLGVVEHGRGRVQAERPVGLDPGIVPALLLLEVGDEHVVREDGAEPELLVPRLGLLVGRAGDPDGVIHRRPRWRLARRCIDPVAGLDTSV